MSIEVKAVSSHQEPPEAPKVKHEASRQERHRLIAHLGRTFARRYDIQVLPSGQRGVWACGLDPKISVELNKYIKGQRDTLDDLPAESFIPKQILYDAETAQEMSPEQITTLLHHEAGHAKYTDFRLMVEGQKQAKDDGYLPTSFWLTFEGIEDPRVNAMEGEESPAIDRQIRANQARDLQNRLTETPLSQRPQMLQFAYNSFHCWLHGKPIPELEGTDVGRVTDVARPLLEQYFQNADLEQRKILQKQIWDVAKELEKKDIEQEEMRQMAKNKGQQPKGGQSDNSGEGQPGGSSQGGGEEQQASSGQGQGQSGQEGGMPGIPGGTGGDNQGQEQETQQGNGRESKPSTGRKKFLDRLKDTIFGQHKAQSAEGDNQQGNESGDGQTSSKGNDGQQASGKESGRPTSKPKQERFDLSKLSPEELQEIKDAIDQLLPTERAELMKKAKEAIDEAQKEALDEKLSKTLKLEKNNETGEYEALPQISSEKQQKQGEGEYQKAVNQVDAEDKAEWERQEAERKRQEEILKQLEKERREKLEMEKAGFDPEEREKFLLYQSLEDSMYSYVRNFRQAIEKVIPRRKEPVLESGYFSGTKFDRRDLIRKAPVGDERFHMRQVERPTGDPRLYIGLLVDNSGSMDGKKMEEARKTMVFFARVCKEMGIPFMGASFGDDAEVIKQFKQEFDNPAEKIKPKIIDATDTSGGSTDLHAGIKVTIEAMNEQRRRLHDSHGLIFVITDGGANAGLTGDDLRNYIEENRGRLTFKGFGLSRNASERTSIQTYLNNYFGESNCVYPEGFADLPDEAFRVLRVNLIQFQKFLS